MEKKLQGIKKKVTECTKCELSATRITQFQEKEL